MKRNPLTPEEDRTRRAVQALARYRGLRNADLARGTGLVPMGVSARMLGQTAFNLTDLYRFSAVLDVEPTVLLMEEDDAIRWAMENAPNRREAGFSQVGVAAGGALSMIVGLAAYRLGVPPAGVVALVAPIMHDESTVMSGDEFLHAA